jgi:hypothetical protein
LKLESTDAAVNMLALIYWATHVSI